MKFFTIAAASLATLAAAETTITLNNEETTALQSFNAKYVDAVMAGGNGKCVDCAQYCSDDSNGSALGAACYIVKCGITCLIG